MREVREGAWGGRSEETRLGGVEGESARVEGGTGEVGYLQLNTAGLRGARWSAEGARREARLGHVPEVEPAGALLWRGGCLGPPGFGGGW